MVTDRQTNRLRAIILVRMRRAFIKLLPSPSAPTENNDAINTRSAFMHTSYGSLFACVCVTILALAYDVYVTN